MPEMRENRVKRVLREGKCSNVLGGLNNPEIVDYMGQFGFDGMWIETEHGPVSWEQVAHMSRACDLWGMTSICRVNSNEPWLITRTLDVGATGIVVPHINTREDAERAAKSAKVRPGGLSRHVLGAPVLWRYRLSPQGQRGESGGGSNRGDAWH